MTPRREDGRGRRTSTLCFCGSADAMDVNDDGRIGLTDPIFLLNYLGEVGIRRAENHQGVVHFEGELT